MKKWLAFLFLPIFSVPGVCAAAEQKAVEPVDTMLPCGVPMNISFATGIFEPGNASSTIRQARWNNTEKTNLASALQTVLSKLCNEKIVVKEQLEFLDKVQFLDNENANIISLFWVQESDHSDWSEDTLFVEIPLLENFDPDDLADEMRISAICAFVPDSKLLTDDTMCLPD